MMNNIESDTDEFFYKGQNYKKVKDPAGLKRGLGVARRKEDKNKVVDGNVDVAPFQQLMHEKGLFVQDNTDEAEEPRKPDYDIF